MCCFMGDRAARKGAYYPGCLRGFNRFDGKRCGRGQSHGTRAPGAAIIAWMRGYSMQFIRVIAALLLSGCISAARGEGAYLGASLGIMDADRSGFDPATNAGVLAGYDLYTLEIFSVALEGELTGTVSDGDLKAAGSKGRWDIDTRALYAAFRLGERFYMKVRFGYAWTDVSTDFQGASFKDSDSGVSWGGAFGWMISEHWGVQLDGSLVDTDTSYWNAGILYRF